MPSPPRGPLWDWVGLDVIWQKLEMICQKVDALMTRVEILSDQERERDMAEQEELANLIARVEENSDAVDSAKMALEGYLTQVATLTAQLEAAIANGGDVSPDIKAAADAIRLNTEQLRAAIPQVAEAVAEGT
jgi:hypothetical protein